ncbi:MAG: amino acid adenylation domain-containing protein [Pseudomonadota bacterium]
MTDAPADQGSANDLERLRDRLRTRLANERETDPGPRRAEATGRAPGSGLSCTQQRLWYLDQQGAGAAYNLTVIVRFRGALDRHALRSALFALVERHEPLRTCFPLVEGEPVPRLLAPAAFALSENDAGPEAIEDRERWIETMGAKESGRTFALETDAPFRGTLLSLGDGDHALLLSVHHIAADGWSRGVLLRELLALYAAFSEGADDPLPPLPIAFSDYAAWQHGQSGSDAMREHIAYWRERLRDAPAQIELPADRPRPRRPSYAGDSVELALDATLTSGVSALAKRHQATVFMVLQAAFVIVLSRLSGQQDIVIGTPIANRRWKSVEGLVGCLLNTLALRTIIEDETTVDALIERVRQATLDAYRHQDLPFEKLVEALQPVRRPGSSPVFQVLFGLQNTPSHALRLRGLEIEATDVRNRSAVVDLTLFLQESGDGIVGTLNYATDLFDRETVIGWADCLRHAIAAMTRNPERLVRTLPLQDANAGRALLERLNPPAPPAPPESTLHGRFEAQVAQRPTALAASSDSERLTYAELNARANRLARHLLASGVSSGTRVPVLMPRSIEMLVAQLALLKAGCTYVPIDPDTPRERQEMILRDCGAAAAIAGPGIARVAGLIWIVPADAAQAIAACEETNLHDPGTPPAPAYVMYTSGSTGMPKGVIVGHRAVLRLCIDNEYLNVTPEDGVAYCSNPAFDASTFEVWAALLNGARLAVVPHYASLDPIELERVLDAQDVTILWLTTSLFNQCVRASDTVFARLRCLLFGGEAADPAIVRLLADRGPPPRLLNMYGPTETTTFATWHAVTSATAIAGSLPIGRPITGARVYVLDPDLAPVPVGVVGEIYIGGSGVAAGYLDRPELTAQRFLRDPFVDAPLATMYRTGDRGRWRSDGELDYLGRTDAQVKIRGFRVELAEIEARLRHHPDVKDAVVIAVEPIAGERQLAAYVIATEGRTPDDGDLAAHLRSALPAYMVPASIVCLPAFPLTPSGKLDRRALPQPDAGDRSIQTWVAPGTTLEIALCELWQSVLAVRRIGITDDFFMLGGNSLSAVRLVNLIRQRFDRAVSLQGFMETPTIRQLAALLAEDGGTTGHAIEALTPDPANSLEPFPLTPIQLAYWVGRNGVAELSNIGAHAYAEVKVVRLDTEKFEATLNRMVARHAALRTVVRPDATQQTMATVPVYRVAVDDYRRVDESRRREGLDRTRAAMSHQVFDGGIWPLFEVRISRLNDDDAIVHCSLDALVLDASSAMVLLDEFIAVYLDPERELPALELGFRDYVLAREAFSRTAQFLEAKAYWTARLSDFPPRPDLPLAIEPARITHPKFERRCCVVPAAQWQALQAIARTHQITPTVLILGCFGEALSRWTQQPRFALNFTLFNRIPFHPEVDAIVGDFTTLVLLEMSYEDRTVPFLERLRRQQRQLWTDLEHRYFDGMDMLQSLRRVGEAVGGYPVVVTSTLGLAQGRTLASLHDRIAGAEGYSITQTSQVWLDVQLFEQGGGLRCNWDSVVGLFPEGMLDAMFAAFDSLLARLYYERDAWHRPVDIDPPPALCRAIEATNSATFDLAPGLLHGPALAEMRRLGGKTAILTRTRRVAYDELEMRSRILAHALIAGGARPGSLIAIVMEKDWRQIVAALGILRAGAAYLPIDASLPQERIALLLKNGEVEQIVTTPAAAERCPSHDARRHVLREELPDVDPETLGEPVCMARPDDLAYVIFTSGSTGTPKGVMIEHRAALNTVLDINRRHRVREDDAVFALSSLSFDLSVYDIFGLLGAGGTVVLPEASDARDPAAWRDLFAIASQREPVTIWNTVPALMRLLVEDVEARPGPVDLRLALLSGDWIPLDLPERIREAMPAVEVVSLGGATEASIWSIAYPIGSVSPQWKSVPYGKALDNQTMHVLQSDFSPSPVWVAGDLYIGGTGLARGYWRDEERTAASFVLHPRTGERLYRTGDRGRLLPDGNIEFLGRSDQQLKIRGYRVEPGEIEARLLSHPDVATAIVVGRPDASGDKRLVAYLTAAGAEPPDTDSLRAHLAAGLPEYMVPAAFVVLDAMPLTSNGKVDVRSLPSPVGAIDTMRVREPPEGEIEEALAEIWRSLLDLDRVDRNDHFFELGGNSLMAVQLVTRIRSTMECEALLADVFAAPRLVDLAERILDRQIASYDPAALMDLARQAGMQDESAGIE